MLGSDLTTRGEWRRSRRPPALAGLGGATRRRRRPRRIGHVHRRGSTGAGPGIEPHARRSGGVARRRARRRPGDPPRHRGRHPWTAGTRRRPPVRFARPRADDCAHLALRRARLRPRPRAPPSPGLDRAATPRGRGGGGIASPRLLGGGGRRRRRRRGRRADRLDGRGGPQPPGPPPDEIGRRGPRHLHGFGDRPASAGADTRVARRPRRRPRATPSGHQPLTQIRSGSRRTSPAPLPTCSTRRRRWRCRLRCTSRTARRSTSCTAMPLPSLERWSTRPPRRPPHSSNDSHPTIETAHPARSEFRCRPPGSREVRHDLRRRP